MDTPSPDSSDTSFECAISKKEIRPHRPTKSYDNTKWLHSRAARHVRILCEYLEVQDRLRSSRILFTVLLFGSARSFSETKWLSERKTLDQQRDALLIKQAASRGEKEVSEEFEDVKIRSELNELDRKVTRLENIKKLCVYWDRTYELSKMLMQWFQTTEARQALARLMMEMPSPAGAPSSKYVNVDLEGIQNVGFPSQVAMCTGGGKGLMEAANKGAHDVEGARSMGMGISLPFEPEINAYVDKDLAFEFHYFFTRKFWMAYSAIAIIATPGGFGTLDELMELLTLKQTGKLKRDIPIVLFGKKFWKDVINFDALVDYGTIAAKDRDQLFFAEEPEEAFNHIKEHILADKLILGDTHIHKSRQNAMGSNITKDVNIF